MPITQAGLLFPTFRYAAGLGADTDSLCQRAGLPTDLLDDPTRFVPTSSWYRLFRTLVREAGSNSVGWQVACAQPLKAYSRELLEGMFGAPSLLEAMRFVSRAHHRHCNSQFLDIRVRGEFAYMLHGDFDHEPGYEQRSAFRTAGIILVCTSFLGDAWKPDLVVTETAPDVYPDCEALEGVPIVRRRGWNAIRFSRADLGATCSKGLQADYGLVEDAGSSAAAQIKQVLRTYSSGQGMMPTLPELAEMMHVSARSLQRRLGKERACYMKLVNSVRYEVARELLANPGLRITEIAHSLGYDDSSHFSRFFRKVGGVSPREFRHQRAGEAGWMRRASVH